MPTTLSRMIFSGHGPATLIAVCTSIASRITIRVPRYGRIRLRIRRNNRPFLIWTSPLDSPPTSALRALLSARLNAETKKCDPKPSYGTSESPPRASSKIGIVYVTLRVSLAACNCQF